MGRGGADCSPSVKMIRREAQWRTRLVVADVRARDAGTGNSKNVIASRRSPPHDGRMPTRERVASFVSMMQGSRKP